MKHTLKSVRALAATLITFGSLAGWANGALTIHVSDAGAGQTQFQLSGSATAISSNYLDNELWLHNQDWVSYPTGGVGYYDFTSGAFTITTTQNGTQNGTRIYYNANFGFGLDVGGPESAISISTGDTVSWAGTFTIQVDFSNWESAAYNNPTFDIFGNGSETVTFSESVLVTTSAVPEPSSALLFGLGALGLATRRRRIK
jgi:hypothetical protein